MYDRLITVITKMNMKQNLIKILGLIFIIQFIGCVDCLKRESNYVEEIKEVSYADSLWLEFATAMETKNLEYLIKTSFDTIQCIDCILDNKSDNEFYDSKMIFKEYLGNLMHIESLTNKEFSTYMNDTIIRVSYSIKCKQALEGGYNLIFTFMKENENFYFDGMFTVP